MMSSDRQALNGNGQLGDRRSIVSWICLFVLFSMTACGSATDSTGNANVQITLLPPAQGAAADSLQIQLRTATQEPITDATVSLEGNMNHAGMAPIIADAVTDAADGNSDGIYQVPFQFSMLGDWIITIAVTLADGSQVTEDIPVTITETDIQM